MWLSYVLLCCLETNLMLLRLLSCKGIRGRRSAMGACKCRENESIDTIVIRDNSSWPWPIAAATHSQIYIAPLNVSTERHIWSIKLVSLQKGFVQLHKDYKRCREGQRSGHKPTASSWRHVSNCIPYNDDMFQSWAALAAAAVALIQRNVVQIQCLIQQQECKTVS